MNVFVAPPTFLRLILLLLLYFLSYTQCVHSTVGPDCPMLGCNPQQQATVMSSGFSALHSPHLNWTVALSAQGHCASQGQYTVVCSLSTSNATTVALDGADGHTQWSLVSAVVPHTTGYPMLLENSQASMTLLWTPSSLVGLDTTTGVPLGPARVLEPEVPSSPTLTTNGVVVLASLYPSGIISSYLTDGVPHASLTLRDTQGGRNGTWTPTSTPALCGSRVYVVCFFAARKPVDSGTPPLVRLYAIDIHRTENDRMVVVWWVTLEATGTSVPPSWAIVSLADAPDAVRNKSSQVVVAERGGSTVVCVKDLFASGAIQWRAHLPDAQVSQLVYAAGAVSSLFAVEGGALVQLDQSTGHTVRRVSVPCSDAGCRVTKALLVLDTTATATATVCLLTVRGAEGSAALMALSLLTEVQQTLWTVALPRDCAPVVSQLLPLPLLSQGAHTTIIVSCSGHVYGVRLET